jgi:hypothetical protein
VLVVVVGIAARRQLNRVRDVRSAADRNSIRGHRSTYARRNGEVSRTDSLVSAKQSPGKRRGQCRSITPDRRRDAIQDGRRRFNAECGGVRRVRGFGFESLLGPPKLCIGRRAGLADVDSSHRARAPDDLPSEGMVRVCPGHLQRLVGVVDRIA